MVRTTAVTDHLPSLAVALCARIVGLWHILRGHDVGWREAAEAGNEDPEMNCAGDILCRDCNLLIWCRWYDTVPR